MKAASVQAKTALVTGCSSGIGRAIAFQLRHQGWHVYPTARSEHDLAHLRSHGFQALQLDVLDPSSIQDCVSSLAKRCPSGIGALVNNAGIVIPGAVEDLSREDLSKQFEVNVFGLQELTNTIIPTLRHQGWGRIVHISSIFGVLTAPMVGGYCASKYALEALANAQRMELRGSGVALSLIEPGAIRSNLRSNAMKHLQNKLSTKHHFHSEYKQTLKKQTASNQQTGQRLQSPEIVARKVHHAIASNHPKRRYFVTSEAQLGAIASRALPDFLIDRLMQSITP